MSSCSCFLEAVRVRICEEGDASASVFLGVDAEDSPIGVGGLGRPDADTDAARLAHFFAVASQGAGFLVCSHE